MAAAASAAASVCMLSMERGCTLSDPVHCLHIHGSPSLMLFVPFTHLHKSLRCVIVVTKGGGYNEVQKDRVGQHRDSSRGGA